MLHELGHFTVAKAVGMRVERFSLFFPPTLFRVRRGETEYAIGAIPAGGYVKITGMSPEELDGLEPEVARRAYYNQAPWKRIVVILAGPGVNILIAFLLFWAMLVSGSLDGAISLGNLDPSVQTLVATTAVGEVERGTSPPTACCARATASSPSTAGPRPSHRRCARSPRTAARARRATAVAPRTPVTLTLRRGGHTRAGVRLSRATTRSSGACCRLRLRRRGQSVRRRSPPPARRSARCGT